MTNKTITALTSASTPLVGTEVLPVVQGSATTKVAISEATRFPIGTNKAIGQSAVTPHIAGNAGSVGLTINDGGGETGVFVVNFHNGTYSEQHVVIRTAEGGVSATTDRVDVKSTGDVDIKTGSIVLKTAAKGINFTANTPAAGMTSQLLNWYEEGTWTPVLARATGGAITTTYNTRTAFYTRIGNLVTVSAFIDLGAVTAQGSGENIITGLPFTPADNSLFAGSVIRNTVFTTDVVVGCSPWSNGNLYFKSSANTISYTSVAWIAGYLNFTVSYRI